MLVVLEMEQQVVLVVVLIVFKEYQLDIQK
jgi:hypothetical protein